MLRNSMELSCGGHKTRLKWHRLRRAMTDGEFSKPVLAQGLRIGASMELDLRVRADGGFVVLHDAALDRETIAVGVVREADFTKLRDVSYRHSGLPVILSEDLAAMLLDPHPASLLQFDMKDDLETIGTQGLRHLTDLFGRSTAPILFSGGCLRLMVALAEHLPDLPRGIDPTDRLVEAWRHQGLSSLEGLLLAELQSAAAPNTCYLHWQLVLEAKARGLDLVGICHGEGVKVDAWTYTLANPETGFSDREWAEFSALLSLGVDQITTDEATATEAAYEARST